MGHALENGLTWFYSRAGLIPLLDFFATEHWIQTPPAIPVLAVAHLCVILRWSRLVIDWHNYGYSILNISRPGFSFRVPARSQIRFTSCLSVFLVREDCRKRCACESLCLKGDAVRLANELGHQVSLLRFLLFWFIRAHVVYDRPTGLFRKPSIEQMHDLFSRNSFGIAGQQPSLVQVHYLTCVMNVDL